MRYEGESCEFCDDPHCFGECTLPTIDDEFCEDCGREGFDCDCHEVDDILDDDELFSELEEINYVDWDTLNDF